MTLQDFATRGAGWGTFPRPMFGMLWRFTKGALSTQKQVDVPLTEHVTATIYARPGEWMDDRALETLRQEIRGVATAAIPGDLNYGVFLPSRAPYCNRVIVIGRSPSTGEVVGFNAMPALDVTLRGRKVTVMHMGLLVIHPAHQRRGYQGLLYGLGVFSLLHRIPERPVWVSSVSEVPAVIGAVAEQFVDVYPHFDKPVGQPPVLHRELAVAIMDKHRHEFGVGPDATFDADRFVIQGSYTGGSDALKKSFESAPRHRVPACNAFCRTQLDYSRGDDVLQLGQLDGTVISNWMSRRLPPAFRPGAARNLKVWSYPK
jgi:hypothetical protein